MNIPEIIKDIPGFEGYYKASNNGYIISIQRTYRTGKNGCTVLKSKDGVLNEYVDKDGYKLAKFSCPVFRGIVKVHRMIAFTHVENPLNMPEVNHYDGIKSNNNDWNLEWCTGQKNCAHRATILKKNIGVQNYLAKLSEEQVLQIIELYKQGINGNKLSLMFNVNSGTIYSITHGKSWKQLTQTAQ